jgi:hypothetical protein
VNVVAVLESALGGRVGRAREDDRVEVGELTMRVGGGGDGMSEDSTMVRQSEEVRAACLDGGDLFRRGRRAGEAEGGLSGDVERGVVDGLFGKGGGVEEMERVKDRDKEGGFGRVRKGGVGGEIRGGEEGGEGWEAVDGSGRREGVEFGFG